MYNNIHKWINLSIKTVYYFILNGIFKDWVKNYGEKDNYYNFCRTKEAKDVEQNGKILLKKDMKMTEQMIKKLQRLLFIGTVQVYDYDKQNSELTLEEKKLDAAMLSIILKVKDNIRKKDLIKVMQRLGFITV